MTAPLLVARDLVKHFPVRKGVFGRQVGAVKAVDGVTLSVRRGEVLGLVGDELYAEVLDLVVERRPEGVFPLVDRLVNAGAHYVANTIRDVPACIDTINTADRPVLAIDIPSGLHADSGAVLGSAVRAARTVTFVGLKIGLFVGHVAIEVVVVALVAAHVLQVDS